MGMWDRYVGLGGPNDSDVRPPRRPGPVAWLIAVIVVALVIACLIANRTPDVPVPDDPSAHGRTSSATTALADGPSTRALSSATR